MKEVSVNTEEVRSEIDEQLDPVIIAQVSEVTGAAPSGSGDPDDNIVWGNE